MKALSFTERPVSTVNNPQENTVTDQTPDTATCTHHAKVRLLGRDARLWECLGDNPGHPGCRAMFVEGYTWRGEPQWIPVPQPVACDHCLDGYGDFLLPVYEQYPNECPECGTACMRTLAPEASRG
ncbi:MAG: hypothetical protein JWO67_1057 [Streptosporangiaceae bacterium]|nr:hypothetical protein [Streptosporangiaceae bacterium]